DRWCTPIGAGRTERTCTWDGTTSNGRYFCGSADGISGRRAATQCPEKSSPLPPDPQWILVSVLLRWTDRLNLGPHLRRDSRPVPAGGTASQAVAARRCGFTAERIPRHPRAAWLTPVGWVSAAGSTALAGLHLSPPF